MQLWGESGLLGRMKLCVITGNKRIYFLETGQTSKLSSIRIGSVRKSGFNYTRISEFIHNGDLIFSSFTPAMSLKPIIYNAYVLRKIQGCYERLEMRYEFVS